MVAEQVSQFFARRLNLQRVAADERRWAISVWLLVVLAGLAWTAIVVTGMILKILVSN